MACWAWLSDWAVRHTAGKLRHVHHEGIVLRTPKNEDLANLSNLIGLRLVSATLQIDPGLDVHPPQNVVAPFRPFLEAQAQQ